ncbi:LysR family transcriptional regulator [Arthrobacter sp. MYb211]|uniref:LysR family transcriptional regulator n=1 Tax=unclassified Arthrobacter TaxID=235627 RepID=UPI000CFDB164|nr:MULTISPECIES: LysR family transcriptional regulator [unclassified Arthrobacter]PRA03319.1 LysR family transcriptional regulator [Arthrobacter sp. MYb229]PRA11848.1 LysR family transcriptional regulator [Arthrobacter sp. MYb221]PRB49729.1 LysR family transcriptional regulator [Arthrobacter sp. MYb216]PRC08391.1 LysR family transcriptional regulator [Arthrobacter sp. MYb211]
MDTRRLQYLYELARMGSMRAVADVLGTTTSTVSQQIAQLSKETGARLLEPDGRGVRLTPAGRRLAEHAQSILGAVDAAKLDLDPEAAPSGTLRVAGFATAIRTTLMPIFEELALEHPAVRIVVLEHEPAEALARLAVDEIDLALTYDYNLAPDDAGPGVDTLQLWSTPWGLGVPTADAVRLATGGGAPDAPAVLAAFRDRDWIGNSRNVADESVLRLLSSMAGFTPAMRHQADSLDLVEDLILAGLGVGLLPENRPGRDGITILPLQNPDLRLRAFARTRKGRGAWPALALVLEKIRQGRQHG